MDFLKKFFFTIFIILVFVLEGFSKYYLYFHATKLDITRYLKLLIFGYIFIYFLYKKKYSFFYIPVLLSIFFVFGHYLLDFKFFDFELMVTFSKYIFPLYLLEFAYLYFKKNETTHFFKTFEIIIVINSILIIIGLIFNLFLFKTYGNNRFGFNGLLITSATSSYFYIIAIFYGYTKLLQSKKHLFLGMFTLLSSLIVGTKSIYLFIALLVFYHIFITVKKITIIKKVSISLLTITVLSILFLKFVPSFLAIKNNTGLLSAILSYRDILFYEKTLPFIAENWSFMNYLIGGQGNLHDRTQLGFVDLLFFFGIIGSLLYLLAFYKSFIKTQLNSKSIFVLLSISTIVFLSGNFFYSATITIYVIVLQQILLQKTKPLS